MTKPKLLIDWATFDSAKYACENWHYSKRMPANKTVKFGIWEDDKFIGVVVFSPGSSATMWKTYGLKPKEGCELSRVALNKHIVPVTRILSICLKKLKQTNSGIRLVISYADTAQGHEGKIYKAGNWVYVGLKGQNTYIVKRKRDNKVIHTRNAKELIARRRARKSDFIWEKAKLKHKFLWIFDKKLKIASQA